MKKLINFIVQNVINRLGYNLVEINDAYEGLISPWALLGGESNDELIVFCNENYNSKIIDELIKRHIDQLKLRPDIFVTKIIFVNENNLVSIKNKLDYISERSYVLVNNLNNRVLGYTNGNENIVNIIEYYVNYTIESENKKKEKLKDSSKVTYTIIGINILMYIITAILSGNIIDSDINVLIFLGAKVNFLIAKGEYYRLITCAFLHGGIVHLGLNMYMLYTLGPLVERIYGKIKYICIYILSATTSSLLSYWMSESVSIGASGAIFGLLGAALIFAIKMKERIGKEFVSNIMSVIVVNLVVGISISNVDNFGHIGGLIGGLISSMILWKKVKL
ncbi:rhomboid family intramembrane serine protease [Clostridium rectalis]|uniref:rhomboid family intramembrane serine protease n=1 Tax=Clostridium rectalis TaxID=2040295 RepID=UPI0019D254C9|nr:rhomboid family intramembrane serine protease [Clostridium rectalis]